MKQGTDILITGGFGFIGLALARHILANDEKARVILLGLNQNDDAVALRAQYPDRLTFDLRDMIDMEDSWYPHVDEVYHCAAVTVSTNVEAHISPLSNIVMFDALMDSFGDRPDVKVVYMSTGEVYGPLWERIAADNFTWPVPERNGLVGVNVYDKQWLYAISKIVGEMSLLHDEPQCRWSIVRLQNPYGPRMNAGTLIPSLVKAAATGAEMTVYVNDTRPFIYIDDVVHALTTIMRSTLSDGCIINVAGDEVELGDVVPIVQKYAGNIKINFMRKDEHLTNHRRALDTHELRSLGWMPWVSLDEGIRKTVEHFKGKI